MSTSIKNNIYSLFRFIVPEIPGYLKEDYASFRFYRNNLMILVLSLFLIFEQIIYGAFFSQPASRLQYVYFTTAFTMALFAVISMYFYKKQPQKVKFYHEVFELSFGAFGMCVALARFLLIEADADSIHIPTIYIAVIYAVAVIYVFHIRQSFILYLSLSLAAIFLMPVFHPEIHYDRYAADIASNGIIAFIISVIHYRNFLKQFMDKNEIEKKNSELVEINRQIENINAELQELSVTDGLTGIFNRRKLDEVMRASFAKARRYNLNFSVIIMDIDYFKTVNDTYGHDAGDVVLQRIAGIILENIRVADTCGRWGGEEFMIICPEIDINKGYLFAERLREIISASSFYEMHSITASFGVASFAECSDLQSLLKIADARLYKAKAGGRNRVEADVPV